MRVQPTTAGRAAVLLVLMLLCAAEAEPRPFRGSVPFSVILCRSSDAGTPPRDLPYFQNLILTAGTGGLTDYWRDVSYQNVNLNGSVVRGWYTVAKTTAQWQALADRWDKVKACEDAAKNDATQPYTIPAGHRKIFITFPGIDFFGWSGGAFVDINVDVGGLAHEGGHGIGLNHSFSNDFEYLNAWWAQVGEYDDPWDAMSWANAFSVATPFGAGPPWMIAYNLDRMGWLPRSRILTFGADGTIRATVTLAALSHPTSTGALLVRVPFDVDDPMRYYTVEFRRKDSWDAGIPVDTVLIHEIRRHHAPDGSYQGHTPFLIRQLSRADKAPVPQLDANGVSIRLENIDTTNHTARVTIVSSFPRRCLKGFVWRESRAYDLVCVPPAERAGTRQENQQAASRVQPGGGAFGPDTCKPGFVWREAIDASWRGDDPDDHVCVPPASRTRARQSNQDHPNRSNPARLTYGPNTCKPGFVWREADDFDWVCVTPTVRSQTRTDNSLAGSRRQPGGGPFGPDTCRSGFVWREAFPGDHVCVLPATRSQAASDNALAESRLLEI
jgi:hypothetical protein